MVSRSQMGHHNRSSNHGVSSGEPYWLERSRVFHCYADIPGVGGGRDIPFKRYDNISLHDKGGMHWFKTDEAVPRDLGLQLRAVTWHVLNEANDYFNRNSMVLSVLEKLADGSVKEHAYAFTDPQTERIALNLKWILANCAITPRQSANRRCKAGEVKGRRGKAAEVKPLCQFAIRRSTIDAATAVISASCAASRQGSTKAASYHSRMAGSARKLAA